MQRMVFILLLLFGIINAQTKDANKLLDAVITQFNKINDYEVDVTVKLDFEMVKIPDMKAKIYFKQPDKIKVDSKGFAMLPKQSVNFSPIQLLKGNYTAIYVKTEIVNNVKMDVVKIIPMSDSTDVLLSSLWIDTDKKIIRKIETTGKKSGTIQIELTYDNPNIHLPSSVVFGFNLGNIPLMTEQRNDEDENNKRVSKRNAQMSGKVFMNYENYKINNGIPDSFFEEKKK